MKLAPAAAAAAASMRRRTDLTIGLMSVIILLVGKGWSAVNDNC
jgi:hypothetical protein